MKSLRISVLLSMLLCGSVLAQGLPEVRVFRDPNCGCCKAWVDHLRANGFRVVMTETADMSAVKKRLGVPRQLESCHTAEIGSYVVEGHVPASSIKRLLAEKPKAKGLGVPGMPLGSPGMEMDGQREPYDVMLFKTDGSARVFQKVR